MHIYVDADACPVIGIVERIAKSHNIAVTLLCDTNKLYIRAGFKYVSTENIFYEVVGNRQFRMYEYVIE